MLVEKVTRENLAEHLVKYELEMVGKTLMDAMDDDKWYFNFTMTREQNAQFKSYAIPLIKKVNKCNKERAENAYAWFDLQFGLRIKN